MTVGDCGTRRPPLGIVGQFGWRTGRDDKMSSVLVLDPGGRTAPLGTLVRRRKRERNKKNLGDYRISAGTPSPCSQSVTNPTVMGLNLPRAQVQATE